MGFVKFIGGLGLITLGIYIGMKGFYSPNSSAADFFFGTGCIFGIGGFYLWII
jgi:hypothetical protein